MLHILLLILKIIGLVFCAILGLLLLLICIVLFTPLKYQASGKSDGTLEHITVKGKGTWLFHLIRADVSFEEKKLYYRLRLGWKRWSSEDESVMEGAQVPEEAETLEEQKEPSEELQLEAQQVEPISAEEEQESQPPEMFSEKKKPASKKKGIRKRIKQFFSNTIEFIKKIKYTFRKLCDKIKIAITRKEQLEAFIENSVHKAAFGRIKKEGMRLLKFLKPKKGHINVRFGFDDPYMTGKVLAGLGMIYPLIGNYTIITPDFEQEVLEGDFFIKGKIRILYMVIVAWNLFWDKNIRITYRHLKQFTK